MHLPGWLRIGPESFRDQMRRFSSADGDAVSQLWKGEDSGLVARVDVSGFCDPDTLRACREINTALSFARDFDRSRPAAGADGARRPRRAARGRAQPRGPLSRRRRSLPRPRRGRRPLRRHRRDRARPLGDRPGARRAVRRLARDAGRRPRHARRRRCGTTARRSPPGSHNAGSPSTPTASPKRRSTASASSPATDANTRLGGPGLLPAGAAWPRTSAGRPLAFLAGLDLAELPTAGSPARRRLAALLRRPRRPGRGARLHRRADAQRARRGRAGAVDRRAAGGRRAARRPAGRAAHPLRRAARRSPAPADARGWL